MPSLSIPLRLIGCEPTPTKLHRMFCHLGTGTSVRRTVAVAEQTTPGTLCDAILHARSPISRPERMKLDARNSLLHPLQVEKLHIDKVNKEVCIGNSCGLDIVQHSHHLDTKLASIQQQLSSLEDKLTTQGKKMATQKVFQDKTISSFQAKLTMQKAFQEKTISSLRAKLTTQDNKIASQKASQDSELASLRSKIASQDATILTQKPVLELTDHSQEARLRSLIESVESYRRIRNRFLSTFKRDYLHRGSKADHQLIIAGHKPAHGGDATVDASLYIGPGARSDFAVFKRLYGLTPQAVQGISE